MKIEEFKLKCPIEISVPTFWSENEDKDVIIDEKAIREDFSKQLEDIIEGTKIFKKEKMSLYMSLKKATNIELEEVVKDLDVNTLFFLFSEINKELDMRNGLVDNCGIIENP